MGILSKQKDKENFLNSQDIEFVLRKLRQAPYTGDEFESFYTVWVKLSDKLKEQKDPGQLHGAATKTKDIWQGVQRVDDEFLGSAQKTARYEISSNYDN